MRAKKIVDEMSAFPFQAEPGMTTREARTLMRKANVRHLPVVESGTHLVGVVSDRDLRTAEGFEDRAALTVRDVMHTDVYTTYLGTKLTEVLEQMLERKVGSAVVVNRIGRVVGIFTTTDALALLRELLEEPRTFDGRILDVDHFIAGHA